MSHRTRGLVAAGWVVVAASAALGADAPAPRGRLDADRRVVFEVAGLDRPTLDRIARAPETGSRYLRVRTAGGPDQGDRPTLLGTFHADPDAGLLRFRSRFPAEPGLSYAAEWGPEGASRPAVVLNVPPEPVDARDPTRVTRVTPAPDLLPENLLKFYITFSAPMGRGQAYDHLKLLDARGEALDLPFLELGEELWDPRGERFTLLFDPGRIKRGLKPREELGPVLEEGKSYTLVIDRRWPDASGRPLAADWRKAFRVGPPDLTPPDPKAWALAVPAAGTRDEFRVRFRDDKGNPETLDAAMLRRVFGLVDAAGAAVPGSFEVDDGAGASCRFVPDRPWAAGNYDLLVDETLEDLAGNSVGRPFEVDVFDRVDRGPRKAAVAALRFEVRGRQ